MVHNRKNHPKQKSKQTVSLKAVERVSAAVRALAAEGKNSHEIYRLLAERYDHRSVVQALDTIYRTNSFFHIIRFPLLFLIIFYSAILIVFLNYSQNFYFGDLSTVLAVFGVPVCAALLLAYTCSERRLSQNELQRESLRVSLQESLWESFRIETLFGFIELFIVLVVSLFFSVRFSTVSALTLLMVFLSLHYLISSFFHLWQRPLPFAHISHTLPLRFTTLRSRPFTSPLFAYSFRLDSYFRRIGPLHVCAVITLLLFLALFFGIVREMFIAVFVLVLLLKSIEGAYTLKSDILLYLLLGAVFVFAVLSSLYLQSIFSVLLLSALVLTSLAVFGHRGILSLPVHFLNILFATIYSVAVIVFLFVLLSFIDSLLGLSSVLSPALFVAIIALILIVGCVMLYYLLFSLTLRTIGTIIPRNLLWPFSRFIPATSSTQKDALLYGLVLAVIILIIFVLVVLLGL